MALTCTHLTILHLLERERLHRCCSHGCVASQPENHVVLTQKVTVGSTTAEISKKNRMGLIVVLSDSFKYLFRTRALKALRTEMNETAPQVAQGPGETCEARQTHDTV